MTSWPSTPTCSCSRRPFMMLGMLIMMGQRAAASADRIYEILDEQPTVIDRARRRRPGRLPRGRPVQPRRLRLRGRRRAAGPGRLRPAHRPGRDGGPGRSDRGRQVDGGPAADPLLRRHRTARSQIDGHDVRDLTHGQPAGQRRGRPRRALPLLGVDPGQHRLRQADRRPRRTSRPRPRRPGADEFISRPGRRLRHGGGRARLHPLGRPTPAHRHRPDPAGQPAHPGPRRRHQRHRRPGGTADPRRRCGS